MIIEACIDDPLSARNAVAGGADRLELCDNLGDGGTTPSHGIVSLLMGTSTIPVFPIIRVRGGGFRYDRDELRVMTEDAAHFASMGIRGMVFGALTDRGNIDHEGRRPTPNSPSTAPSMPAAIPTRHSTNWSSSVCPGSSPPDSAPAPGMAGI